VANVAALVAPDGMLAMTLRHGPVPAGRLMFAVSAETPRSPKRTGSFAPTSTESSQAANETPGV
jgi:hypothetical protein